jgi:hypothetical protein
MKPYITAIERAFELAKSGRFLYLSEVREQLRSEGYFTETISGPLLCGQLKATIEAALKDQHKPLPQGRKDRELTDIHP